MLKEKEAKIKAREKVTMAVFSKENVRKMLALYPQINENYIIILSEKIHFLNNKISTYKISELLPTPFKDF